MLALTEILKFIFSLCFFVYFPFEQKRIYMRLKKTHTKSVNITTFYSASRTVEFIDGLDLDS